MLSKQKNKKKNSLLFHLAFAVTMVLACPVAFCITAAMPTLALCQLGSLIKYTIPLKDVLVIVLAFNWIVLYVFACYMYCRYRRQVAQENDCSDENKN